MKHVQDGLSVQNISNLVLKEITVFIKQKTLQKIKLKNTEICTANL